MAKDVFWCGRVPLNDDFGRIYGTVMYDAKTRFGHWANMSEESWQIEGGTCGQLGTGLGQKYELQEDGRWLKVEG
jgi:hypothetical protein